MRWISELSQMKNNSEKLFIFIVLNNNFCVAAQMLTSSKSRSGAGTENSDGRRKLDGIFRWTCHFTGA